MKVRIISGYVKSGWKHLELFLRKLALKFTRGILREKLDLLRLPDVWIPSKLDTCGSVSLILI